MQCACFEIITNFNVELAYVKRLFLSAWAIDWLIYYDTERGKTFFLKHNTDFNMNILKTFSVQDGYVILAVTVGKNDLGKYISESRKEWKLL